MKFTQLYLVQITALFFFMVGTTSECAKAQPVLKSHAIIGTWQPEEGDFTIQIFDDGDEFKGKIVWLKEPNDKEGKPKIDILNPERRLRSRPVLNMVNMTGFMYNDTEKTWEDGFVYYPDSGETLLGSIYLKDTDTLILTGFIGFSLEEVRYVWKRIRT